MKETEKAHKAVSKITHALVRQNNVLNLFNKEPSISKYSELCDATIEARDLIVKCLYEYVTDIKRVKFVKTYVIVVLERFSVIVRNYHINCDLREINEFLNFLRIMTYEEIEREGAGE